MWRLTAGLIKKVCKDLLNVTKLSWHVLNRPSDAWWVWRQDFTTNALKMFLYIGKHYRKEYPNRKIILQRIKVTRLYFSGADVDRESVHFGQRLASNYPRGRCPRVYQQWPAGEPPPPHATRAHFFKNTYLPTSCAMFYFIFVIDNTALLNVQSRPRPSRRTELSIFVLGVSWASPQV